MAFKFEKTAIPDVILIQPQVFGDKRGFFMETYKQAEFAKNGITDVFVQDSQSLSGKGVLRGMHYQTEPKAQAKLVRCIRGEIFDVAVDIRPGSPTFGRWVGVTLSEENRAQLFIPRGFAHGFCVTSDSAEIMYKQSNEYAPECERGILWNDPVIGIAWPISNPVIAERDGRFPTLSDAFPGISPKRA